MTQLRTGLRWGLGVLVAVGLMGIPCVMRAQEARAEEGGEAPDLVRPVLLAAHSCVGHSPEFYGIVGRKRDKGVTVGFG